MVEGVLKIRNADRTVYLAYAGSTVACTLELPRKRFSISENVYVKRVFIDTELGIAL